MAEVVLRWKANQNEVIKYANFVDDERPQYLFIVLENERSHLQHLKLVKIQGIEQTVRGNQVEQVKKIQFARGDEFEQRKKSLEKIVKRKFLKGEVTNRRYEDDNFYCQLDHSTAKKDEKRQKPKIQISPEKLAESKGLNQKYGGPPTPVFTDDN